MATAADIPRASETPSHSFIHAMRQPVTWILGKSDELGHLDPVLGELLLSWQEIEKGRK